MWRELPSDLRLGDGEVHVWRARLETTPERTRDLQRTLAPDERERAERFHFAKDRNHYTVARGLLRTILGRYLGVEPGQLRFRYSPHGKPALAPGYDREGFCFNLSHSNGLALYAVTQNREIGVDLEYIREDFARKEIAERFFSPAEVTALRALPPSVQTEAFFNCWTRKEAYIKARGEGLSLPLDQFSVSLEPGAPAALLHTLDDQSEAARWSLQALAPGTEYAAALALEGPLEQLETWQWPEE